MGSKLPRSISCPHPATCGTPSRKYSSIWSRSGVPGVATPDMVGHHGEHLGVGWHSPQELPLEAAADPYRVTFGAQPRGLGNSEGQVTTDPPSLSSEATPTTQGRPSLWAETPSQVGDIPSLALSQDPGGPWLDPPAPVSSSTNENQYNRRGDLCIRERKDVLKVGPLSLSDSHQRGRDPKARQVCYSGHYLDAKK